MPTTLQLEYAVNTRAEPSPRALEVAAMFGLSLDETQQQTIIPPTELTLEPGQVVFLTGVSGGGKSTLLRHIGQDLQAKSIDHAALSAGVVRVDELPALPDQPLVEALAWPEGTATEGLAAAPLREVCCWLSRAGLNDAAVMLRRPGELSEGQRYRLRLAQAIAIAERQRHDWSALLADEFGSTLDRTTARALAHSVRRWVTRSGVCLIAATAHDDLLEPLDPDVLVEVEPGGICSVHPRPA